MAEQNPAIQFEAWPKIPRYNRGIVITEKIDGTNAAVLIVPVDMQDYDQLLLENFDERGETLPVSKVVAAIRHDAFGDKPESAWFVYAQSRTRFITPKEDNYGFASWVRKNAGPLVRVLGEGRHFGEWWGAGIQRGYGLRSTKYDSGKRFSLFNARRWQQAESKLEIDLSAVPGLGTVPILYEGPMREDMIDHSITALRNRGSFATPHHFDRPEGIVVYHDASRTSFKITLEKDEAPKGPEAHRNDEEKRS